MGGKPSLERSPSSAGESLSSEFAENRLRAGYGAILRGELAEEVRHPDWAIFGESRPIRHFDDN